ncbi:chitobiase/beta-hexosaminidase C-terminal domain-containing protein [Paenibacillus sp. JTLBN-2024]
MTARPSSCSAGSLEPRFIIRRTAPIQRHRRPRPCIRNRSSCTAGASAPQPKLQAYAAMEGKEDSEVKTFEYQVIPLSATPPPGDVAAGTAVALSSSIPGASIFYTLDGTDPLTSVSKRLYTEPLIVEEDVTIRAYVSDGANAKPFGFHSVQHHAG